MTPGKSGWQPRKIGDAGETADLQERLAGQQRLATSVAALARGHHASYRTHMYEQYPRVSRGGEEERLDRTDSMITTTTVTQTQSRLP